MWRPLRSKTGWLVSGFGSSATNVQISRMMVSIGDQLFSSASDTASRAWGIPVIPLCARAYVQSSSMATR